MKLKKILSGKIINRLSLFMVVAVCALMSVGCSDDDDTAKILGGGDSEVLLTSKKGTRVIKIESGKEWSAQIVPASEWVTFKGATTGTGNGELTIKYSVNNGFPRKTGLVIKTGGKTDTIFLKQYGLTPTLEFVTKECAIPATSMGHSARIATNIPVENIAAITFKTIAADQSAATWIKEVKCDELLESVSFSVDANATTSTRIAGVVASFRDDWGKVYTTEYKVSQFNFGGTQQTKEVTYDQLHALISGATGTLEIKDDICITGVISSDRENPNVAANIQVNVTDMDYDENYKTAYLQNAAGTWGVCLKTVDKNANQFHQYNNLKLWLKGLTLVKEANPERYTLKGITYGNPISLTPGSASNLIVKERTINTLTDADMYTFVKLTDCELPIAEGSYTPINEGYGSAYNGTITDMYPLLVRDINGGSMFLMTNLSCPYRRNGQPLPQGSGTISGVIVHETFDRFEQDGNIGKYQIRHLKQADIALAADASAGFSALIAQWSNYNRVSNLMQATAGEGNISQTSSDYTGTAYASSDLSHLGPIDGKTDGKGWLKDGGFANAFWWNTTTNAGESWVISFSTKNVTTSNLSMQITAGNNAVGAPRYWVAEWSDNSDQAGTWTEIAQYTVPDAPVWSATLATQLPGHKNINFNLPLAMLGKDNVYIRLRVTQNKAGSNTGYDDSEIVAKKASSLSYVAIRYNK